MLQTQKMFLFIMLLALPVLATAQDDADAGNGEEQGLEVQATATIMYNPEQTDKFKHLDNMEVVYVANFWNTRRGTRLALRENILRPDTSRLMRAPLVKHEGGWEATLTIPPNAAVLSYYITDGENIDDNSGRTFTAYVYTIDNVPVPNAHYFTVPFLELSGATLEERLRESEQEILTYPKNFRAYTQYFGLYLQIERGSERAQKRIIKRLQDLEKQYGDNMDCLNLIARTYYYLLRDQKTGLKYKERIQFRDRWQEVERMFDADEHNQKQRERALRLQRIRASLLNSEPPEIDFLQGEGKVRVQDYKGSPMIVVFWASSSQLSLDLFKELDKLHDRYEDRGLKIFTINAGENQETVDAFKAKHDYPFIYTLNNGAAIVMYGVSGLPQAYILNKDGLIKEVVVGYDETSLPNIKSALEKVL